VATEKWTNYARRHKCQIEQGKRTELARFPRINKKYNTENKESIKLRLFYCKISTLF